MGITFINLPREFDDGHLIFRGNVINIKPGDKLTGFNQAFIFGSVDGQSNLTEFKLGINDELIKSNFTNKFLKKSLNMRFLYFPKKTLNFKWIIDSKGIDNTTGLEDVEVKFVISFDARIVSPLKLLDLLTVDEKNYAKDDILSIIIKFCNQDVQSILISEFNIHGQSLFIQNQTQISKKVRKILSDNLKNLGILEQSDINLDINMDPSLVIAKKAKKLS